MAGVSLDLPANRTVAVVGESGSGKTVISQAVLGILPANARITGGSIWFNDPQREGGAIDLAAFAQNSPERREIRGGSDLDHLPGADELALAPAHDRRPDR